MFKLIQVFQTTIARQRRPVRNTFHSYAVAMPAHLLPILQNRLTYLLLSKLHGEQYPGFTMLELLDLDSLVARYDSDEAHHLILDGRQLSLLKRFLEIERGILGRSRKAIPGMTANPDLWVMLGDLHLAVIRPTQLVNLSFYY